jgi:uncharacterized membrane protein YjjP (DUF1212 family)
MEKIKTFFIEWWSDIVKGLAGGSFASYIFNHLSDLFWTSIATILITILTHISKKKVIPWLENKGII